MQITINKTLLPLIIVIILGCAEPSSTSRSIQPTIGVLGDSAMIVTAHPLATSVGYSILKAGGNAIDAAIATQFALAVVYPRAGNIGGGGFALLRLADGSVNSLDFREKAPGLASKDMFLDEHGNVIPNLSTRGHLAAGVPGSVAGMWELHQQYGSYKWADLLQPAILLAYNGFEITQNEAEALNEKQEDFKLANSYQPWVIKEEGWKKGDLAHQPELSATLTFIRDHGRDGFYRGIVAQQIVKEMQQGAGIISAQDLINYQPVWRKPVEGTYYGHRVIGMPPPSSGGIAVIQLLRGSEQLNIREYLHNSAEAVHLMSEVEQRVFADRAKYLGDPDFYDVPQITLLSESYNRRRFEEITVANKTPSTEIQEGEVLSESPQTTHFSIVDQWGNAVSLTTTLNLNYGCKVWVRGAGFVLNDEMDDFSSKPGTPNYYGLIGAKANAIEPNKRMLSAMTPTMVEKDGQLKMVVGTPGGSTILTSVFQIIRNVIDYNMTMQEAVNAKRVHHQWLPDQIKYEKGALSESVLEKLTDMGYAFEVVDKIGRTDCILIRADGSFEGGADYTRGDDLARGF